MSLARKSDLLHGLLAAVLILTAFHPCGHGDLWADSSDGDPASVPARGAAETPTSDGEIMCPDCAVGDGLCLCRAPGLSAETSPVAAPLAPAGVVILHGEDGIRDLPDLIDHPPRFI